MHGVGLFEGGTGPGLERADRKGWLGETAPIAFAHFGYSRGPEVWVGDPFGVTSSGFEPEG
jgi:hypothetical protein